MSVKRILFLDLFIIITMNFCSYFRYLIITVGGQDNDIKKNLFIANVKQTFVRCVSSNFIRGDKISIFRRN